jgi:hypothetical protein
MYRMILLTQWKWTRAIVLIATILGFALPLASLQAANGPGPAADFVARMQGFGVWYALLAAAIGLMVALTAWAHDQRGRHVYALVLPVPRAHYVLMRLGAGLSFLVPPTIAVLLGALFVAVFGDVPSELTVYPFALTLRFLFAAGVAYTLFFAIGSATQKTAGILLGAMATVLLTQYLFAVLGVDFDLLERAVEFLFRTPGVFSVFSGRWSLVDA